MDMIRSILHPDVNIKAQDCHSPSASDRSYCIRCFMSFLFCVVIYATISA